MLKFFIEGIGKFIAAIVASIFAGSILGLTIFYLFWGALFCILGNCEQKVSLSASEVGIFTGISFVLGIFFSNYIKKREKY